MSETTSEEVTTPVQAPSDPPSLGKLVRGLRARWLDTRTPKPVEWVLLAVMLAFFTVTFFYSDTKVTTWHSLTLIDCIRQGRILDFYEMAAQKMPGGPAVYDIPVYLILAVWNVPVYVARHFIGEAVLTSFPCLLWTKLLLVGSTVFAAWLLHKIAQDLGVPKDRSRWIMVLFLTAPTVVIPVFMIAQIDILTVVFMLLGLRSYLGGRIRSFLLWFLVANTLKMFAVFMFVPLVLLKEKRLTRIVGQGLVGGAGMVACKLLFGGNISYQASTHDFVQVWISFLQVTGFAWKWLTMPAFVVVMALVALVAYVSKPTAVGQAERLAVYLPFVAFLSFIVLVPINPYWMVLVAPFAVLMPFITPRHFRLNMFLECVIGAVVAWMSMTVVPYLFGGDVVARMALSGILPSSEKSRFASPGDMVSALTGGNTYLPILGGLMLAAAVTQAVILYPRARTMSDESNTETIDRGLVAGRSLIGCVVAALVVFCYALPAKPLQYDAYGTNLAASSVDILEPNSVVSQTMTFDTPVRLKTMAVAFDAKKPFDMADVSYVTVSWVRADDGRIVWRGSRATNMFVTEALQTFSGRAVVLEPNVEYTVTISGSDRFKTPLHVMLNKSADVFPTAVNGQTVPGDIAMQIPSPWF